MFKALLATIAIIIAAGTGSHVLEDGSAAQAAFSSVTGSDKPQAGPFDLGGDRTVDSMLNTHNTTFNY